jgi:hypothetical protein
VRRIEAWGAQLAYLLRERQERQAAVARVEAEISELEARILAEESGRLLENTGSQPTIGDERETQVFRAPEEVSCPGRDYCALWGNDQHVHLATGQVWLRS